MVLEALISYYGYAVVFFGAIAEGETFLVLGGYLAHRGYLSLPLVLAVAFAGTIAGDNLFFYIGRKKGSEFLQRLTVWRSKSERALAMIHRHQLWVIFGFRFLYGLRMVTPFLLGSSGVDPLRFALINGVGAAVWAITMGILGYLIGETVELVLVEVKHYEIMVGAVIVVCGLVLWLIHLQRARRRGARSGAASR
jgi:membrane protein DedA with SNARE-associated domain